PPAQCGFSLPLNDADVWPCEYPGPSSPRSPVSACSLVSSLLLVRATMRQDSSLTQSGHSIRQALTAYTLSPFPPTHHEPLPLMPSQSNGITVRESSQWVFCNTIGG